MHAEFASSSRGYVLSLEQDLFGAFVLYRRWFGLTNKRGGMKRQVFLDEESAIREFLRIEKVRARRGYRKAQVACHNAMKVL